MPNQIVKEKVKTKPKKSEHSISGKGKPRGSHKVRRTATRLKVLEAGIEVLGELGYHAATTTLVARRAGVSRGALLHQFPTHCDLMLAIVEHIIMKNHERNARVLAELQPGVDQYKGLTEALWQQSQTPGTIAIIEIHMASRSNPELAKRLGVRISSLIRSELEYTWHLAQEAGIQDRHAVDALSTLTIASIWGLSIMRLKLWKDSEIDDAYELLKNNRDLFIQTHRQH